MMWTTIFLYIINLAQAASLSLASQPRPWNISKIDITFVDYLTPQQTTQAEFGFGLNYRPTQYFESWCRIPRQAPNGTWNFCAAYGLHARITDVKISDSVEFDLHLQRYSWTKYVAESLNIH
jgi:hypothetical protein